MFLHQIFILRLHSAEPIDDMNTRFSSKTSGYALLTTLLITSFIGLTISLGISSSVVSDIRRARTGFETLGTYVASESGVEDMVYRVRKGKPTQATTTLSLNGTSVTTTLSNIASGKQIVSEGVRSSSTRRIETVLEVGESIPFFYGAHVGNGGFVMGSNAIVDGNVYANGGITGSNGAQVTGTAISANSIPLLADQTNELPLPPTSNVRVGGTNPPDIAQSFVVSQTAPVNKVSLYIRRVGTPGPLSVRIVRDVSGAPGEETLVSQNLQYSEVGTSYGWEELIFATNPELAFGFTYWLVVDGSFDASHYYEVGGNNLYLFGSLSSGEYGSSWSSVVPSGDMYMRIYLGGITGLINNVDVAVDARAHTVSNSTIGDELICKIGISNGGKSCNTGPDDLGPEPFPISVDDIERWKDDAEAGGVITGNHTISVDGSLGPKKITGNLTVNINKVLTVTGTLWVEGRIILNNGSKIVLSPSYGPAGGIIISDGRITLSNNSSFEGSGQDGSVVLLITLSDCPISLSCLTNPAINIGNNAGAVVLYAPYGSLHFSNNTQAKEATAYQIIMDSNAELIYEAGLANGNFSSGPAGSGYDISSWKEVE